LARQSIFNIGTSTVSGGALEVGNPVAVDGGRVDFTLAQRDPDCIFHIDRTGYLGFGAGVIDKHGTLNGDADVANNPVIVGGAALLDEDGNPIFTPDTALASGGWTIQQLYDVGDVNFAFRGGQLEHNNIADGSSRNASLMAIGPAESYSMDLNGRNATVIRGGGNLALIPEGTTVYNANVWDYAGQISSGESYSILASAPLLLDRARVGDIAPVPYRDGGNSFAFTTPATAATDFYNLLAFLPTVAQPDSKACWGTDAFDIIAGFVNADVLSEKYGPDLNIIRRLPNLPLEGGAGIDGLNVGAVIARSDGDIDPSIFGLLKTE